MKNILIAITALLIYCNMSFAQNAHFTTSGTIEFEKTVNTYALVKRLYGKEMDEGITQQAFDQYKKTQPQFKVLKSTLTFGGNKTLFTPAKSEGSSSNFIYVPMTDQGNLVYSDMSTNICTDQRTVFEQSFLVKDTLRKIKWKITDENRDIAGYNCRRANGLMMDSIYVVAFYTDKIPVSGGPESFNGLPGMILEVALPHENVIWRAIKVNDVEIQDNQLIAPKKGKPLSNKQYSETLQSLFKGKGDADFMNLILKWSLL